VPLPPERIRGISMEKVAAVSDGAAFRDDDRIIAPPMLKMVRAVL
jgi:hypothetical protein